MSDDIRHQMIALLPRMRAFARSLTRVPDTADDLVQQTCEKALRGMASFQPGTRLDVWLFRILRNTWIDTCRANRAHMAIDELEDSSDALMGEDGRRTVEARLELSAVERAMATLPQDQQDVLSMVCVAGLGYREAAEALDIPPGTVMSRLSRARQSLHQILNAPSVSTSLQQRTHPHARPE